MQFKFTRAAIDRLPSPAIDREYHTDSELTGFRLAAFASGKMVFYVYKKIDGRPERIKLGEYPATSVNDARERAKKLIGEIADGKNPAHERRQLHAEATLGELFAWYLDRHAKAKKRSWAQDQTNFDLYLKPLAQRKLSKLSRKDFATLHHRITQNGHATTANRVLALASSMFGRALKAGMWVGANPCIGVERNRETHRRRFLAGDELRRFLAAVKSEPNTNMRDYVMLSLLTGARRSNVQTMRWNEVRFDLGQWHVPAGKAKANEPLVIPLAPEAAVILRQRQSQAVGEFVFPSTRAGKHGVFQGIGKRWQALLKRAGVSDLRPHDLRHTLASWQVRTGTSLSVIGATLGHKSSATTAIYAHADQDPVRVSVERATAAMLAEGESAPKAAVRPLRRKNL